MPRFSLYDTATGVVVGHLECSAEQLEANLSAANRFRPVPVAALEEDVDPHSQRVDTADPAAPRVVDHRPPRPDADHDWSDDLRRWVKRPEAAAAEAADRLARVVIAAGEAAQLRAIRELLLNPNDQTARDRLRQIDDTIAATRPQIRRGTAE